MCEEPSPADEAALDALATFHNIELEYNDAYGRQQSTSRGARRKLLAALGVQAESNEAIAAALAEAELARWHRALPPTIVAHRGRGPFSAEIVLRSDTRQIQWCLILEEGAAITGTCDFATLPLLETSEVGESCMARRRLVLDDNIPDGYHTLSLDPGGNSCRFIVTPGRCWLPETREDGRRLWGIAAQHSLIRSEGNWGIGDFTDLRQLTQHAASNGIDIVGVSPMHASFLDVPEQASPYAPSTRLLLNVLTLDVSSVPGFAEDCAAQELMATQGFQRKLSACRESGLVEYATVASLKLAVLRVLYARAAGNPDSHAWREFGSFRDAQGKPLQLGSVFQALRTHFAQTAGSQADWRTWPPEFQHPESPAVAAFAHEHAEEISFYAWLQWQADLQLAAAAEAGRSMKVGLYRDLAIGTDPAGAECWSNQSVVLATAHVGAPPDLFYSQGQDWGLAALNPESLRNEGYASFVALLRANMRHAGALRLDHAMALQHVWCIPNGFPASEGAYIRYALEDLLGVLALESQRNRCLIIGEDLGTVPAGFRERMSEARVLSYRVLTFERTADGGFLPASAYPRLAIGVAGNHDLPTLRGWWEGRDIALDAQLRSPASAEDIEGRLRQRHDECVRLLESLHREGLLAVTEPVTEDTLVRAVHGFLGRTPCLLAMVQLDDLAGEVDPVNLPGTTDQYPNWRRRLSVPLESLIERLRGWGNGATGQAGHL
jgi:4-alpha-glucanotransferase